MQWYPTQCGSVKVIQLWFHAKGNEAIKLTYSNFI